MGHSVDNNITNRYINDFPLARQMDFNSRLLRTQGTYSGSAEGVDCYGEEILIASDFTE